MRLQKTKQKYLLENQTYQNDSDAALVRYWQQGDEQAFDTLYKRYVINLLNMAFQKTGSRELAKELVQEVFLELYIHRHKLEIHNSLGGYLFTILKNKVYNHYRHQLVEEKYRQHIRITGEQQQSTTIKRVEQKELLQRIQQHIQRLPTQCRTVFLLSREEHLTNKEIAEKLQISVHTVEQHIRKARQLLRESLGDYEFGLLCICMATSILA